MMLVSEAIDRALNTYLYPAGVNRPAFDILAADITSNAVQLTTQGLVAHFPQAIVEIESELLLTKEAEISGAVDITLRGYLETDAAAHLSGQLIWINPDYPRRSIFNAIVTIIRSLYPKGLYVLENETQLTADLVNPLTLDASVKDVLSVHALDSIRWQRLTESNDYHVLKAWDPPKLQIFDAPYNGASLLINYKKDFTVPTLESQDLTTHCNVPAHLAEYIPMAAAGHLLLGKEFAQFSEDTRHEFKEGDVPPGTKISVGERLLAAFDREVEAAKRIQRERTPPGMV